MNVATKIAKESTITFSGMLYGNINRYLYTALLARWVGPEYLGIYSLANAIMLISEVLAKMGLETGIMRFVSQLNPEIDGKKIRSIIGSALKMTIFSSCIIMFILIISSGTIVRLLNESLILKTVVIIFAIAIPFNALTMVSAFATQGFKRLKYKIIVTQFFNPTILLLSMVFCYWFISNQSSIMIPMLITGVTGFIFMFINLKSVSELKINHLIDSTFDTQLLKFSYPLMFVTMLQTLMHWMDILMLGYFVDASIVGLYHPAARTAGLLQALLLSFLSIYAPLASQFYGEGKIDRLLYIYKLVSRWLMICALPISSLFIIYPEKVMLLFGPEYLSSAQILVILTIGTLLQSILGAAGPTLTMAGYTKLVLWNTISAFIINFTLNIWLIPIYGILGAAIATFISLTLIGLVRVIQVRIILKINFIDIKFLKPILAGLMTYFILFFLKPYILGYHTLATLSIAASITLLLFGLFIWLMGIEEEDKDFLRGLGVLKESITIK